MQPQLFVFGKAVPVALIVTSGESVAKAPSYSGANVMVTGIDEPDLVRTYGKYIYYA